ncbi:oxidoreductase domain-containing protein [Boeremia exigua]|uniref:oxidoreductase domain-containing protein n=1 Tax=Boeremia exigua TaxID=749465 RepID=UPI001E8D0E2B|nr:oxidoreductase domain-containing protein [Boeremia exigua]KAH6643109.1 oxidoreductase domain-containing protein [Boeremia exigua]
MAPSPLPEGFLSGPAPNLTRTNIDLHKNGILPGYTDIWAVVLDGVLSEKECDELIAGAEATTDGKWERAMVNIGCGQQAMYEDIRKCGRIIWDDRDLVAKLWARIEGAVPEIHELNNWPNVTGNGPAKRNETWKLTRLNERMRYLKYVGGEYFKPHCDGTYETPDLKERSYFTLHLYLNDADDSRGQEPLIGGATTFHSYNMQSRVDVVPKYGRVLLFQHRFLLHSGDDVVSGTKYTMRTDVMFTKEAAEKAGSTRLHG